MSGGVTGWETGKDDVADKCGPGCLNEDVDAEVLEWCSLCVHCEIAI